jgi:phage virion morphogenesis protein
VAASGIKLEIQLEETLSPALARGLAAGSDLTPAMMSIAQKLHTAVQLRFEREEGPGGKPWKRSERARTEGGKTLQLSGDLLSSIDSRWGPAFAEVGPQRSFGSAVYAAIHQFGGTIRAKAKKALSFGGRILASVFIPARAYLGFDQADREMIAEELADHLRGAIEGSSQ